MKHLQQQLHRLILQQQQQQQLQQHVNANALSASTGRNVQSSGTATTIGGGRSEIARVLAPIIKQQTASPVLSYRLVPPATSTPPTQTSAAPIDRQNRRNQPYPLQQLRQSQQLQQPQQSQQLRQSQQLQQPQQSQQLQQLQQLQQPHQPQQSQHLEQLPQQHQSQQPHQTRQLQQSPQPQQLQQPQQSRQIQQSQQSRQIQQPQQSRQLQQPQQSQPSQPSQQSQQSQQLQQPRQLQAPHQPRQLQAPHQPRQLQQSQQPQQPFQSQQPHQSHQIQQPQMMAHLTSLIQAAAGMKQKPQHSSDYIPVVLQTNNNTTNSFPSNRPLQSGAIKPEAQVGQQHQTNQQQQQQLGQSQSKYPATSFPTQPPPASPTANTNIAHLIPVLRKIIQQRTQVNSGSATNAAVTSSSSSTAKVAEHQQHDATLSSIIGGAAAASVLTAETSKSASAISSTTSSTSSLNSAIAAGLPLSLVHSLMERLRTSNSATEGSGNNNVAAALTSMIQQWIASNRQQQGKPSQTSSASSAATNVIASDNSAASSVTDRSSFRYPTNTHYPLIHPHQQGIPRLTRLVTGASPAKGERINIDQNKSPVHRSQQSNAAAAAHRHLEYSQRQLTNKSAGAMQPQEIRPDYGLQLRQRLNQLTKFQSATAFQQSTAGINSSPPLYQAPSCASQCRVTATQPQQANNVAFQIDMNTNPRIRNVAASNVTSIFPQAQQPHTTTTTSTTSLEPSQGGPHTTLPTDWQRCILGAVAYGAHLQAAVQSSNLEQCLPRLLTQLAKDGCVGNEILDAVVTRAAKIISPCNETGISSVLKLYRGGIYIGTPILNDKNMPHNYGAQKKCWPMGEYGKNKKQRRWYDRIFDDDSEASVNDVSLEVGADEPDGEICLYDEIMSVDILNDPPKSRKRSLKWIESNSLSGEDKMKSLTVDDDSNIIGKRNDDCASSLTFPPSVGKVFHTSTINEFESLSHPTTVARQLAYCFSPLPGDPISQALLRIKWRMRSALLEEIPDTAAKMVCRGGRQTRSKNGTHVKNGSANVYNRRQSDEWVDAPSTAKRSNVAPSWGTSANRGGPWMTSGVGATDSCPTNYYSRAEALSVHVSQFESATSGQGQSGYHTGASGGDAITMEELSEALGGWKGAEGCEKPFDIVKRFTGWHPYVWFLMCRRPEMYELGVEAGLVAKIAGEEWGELQRQISVVVGFLRNVIDFVNEHPVPRTVDKKCMKNYKQLAARKVRTPLTGVETKAMTSILRDDKDDESHSSIENGQLWRKPKRTQTSTARRTIGNSSTAMYDIPSPVLSNDEATDEVQKSTKSQHVEECNIDAILQVESNSAYSTRTPESDKTGRDGVIEDVPKSLRISLKKDGEVLGCDNEVNTIVDDQYGTRTRKHRQEALEGIRTPNRW